MAENNEIVEAGKTKLLNIFTEEEDKIENRLIGHVRFLEGVYWQN
ncbi:hypothetical protein [Pseudoramibacter faecis]|nr:hypothetical protein [Pseudoramibacter sp. HA2172]